MGLKSDVMRGFTSVLVLRGEKGDRDPSPLPWELLVRELLTCSTMTNTCMYRATTCQSLTKMVCIPSRLMVFIMQVLELASVKYFSIHSIGGC